ncbi:tyrosine recombinase XerC [Thalassobius sp. Cn5-15]|uniref:site-specific integrase n=1 Tax=Thalassobius sp. Cn5-15 TaxID=2917763 RepID=UPI001EF1F0D3|nr:tyrosine-type recombinase/integrase [Thalassobius sp. Cn5-15]MCG7494717.1 tyrosine-type recombinase/integrase [Thalassobius sp. Cn5-15]
MKLKYIDMVGKDKSTPRYRRRIPILCQEALGKEWFQVHLRNKSGARMIAEWETIGREFDKLIADTTKRLKGEDNRSPATLWRDAILKAEGVLDGVIGLDRDDARTVVADSLIDNGEDPMVIKAVLAPDTEAPAITLLDARNIYAEERVKGDPDKTTRLERHVARMEHVLGPLKDMPLVSLKREHGRKVRDYLLNTYKKKNGKKLSVASIRREISIMSAMVALGIREHDLDGKAINPFTNLELPKSEGRKSEKRLPLPDDVVTATRAKLMTLKKNPALHLTWRIMAGTSAHAKEVAYLELQDIDLEREALSIRANNLRGDLKTGSRDRDIPLVGDALEAAKEAVELAGKNAAPTTAIFPRYSKSRRSHDNLSGILKKHLEAYRTSDRHTPYCLRHRISAKLRVAGAEQVVIDRVLGHSIGGIGAATYGGTDDRLEVDRKWLKKALR